MARRYPSRARRRSVHRPEPTDDCYDLPRRACRARDTSETPVSDPSPAASEQPSETEPYYLPIADEVDVFRAAFDARLPVLDQFAHAADVGGHERQAR